MQQSEGGIVKSELTSWCLWLWRESSVDQDCFRFSENPPWVLHTHAHATEYTNCHKHNKIILGRSWQTRYCQPTVFTLLIVVWQDSTGIWLEETPFHSAVRRMIDRSGLPSDINKSLSLRFSWCLDIYWLCFYNIIWIIWEKCYKLASGESLQQKVCY